SLENKLDNLEGDWEEKLTDIENSTHFTEQIIKQTDFSASLAALKDISNRVGELEQIIKKVESNLTEINKPRKTEPKKKAAAPAPKASKSSPKSDPKE
ncbi:MAG: hypothetical protein PHF24_02955, partial [Syntrophomonas sp.]|nr:hypothetical protein [Syntrophomonas sp.]